MSTGNEDSARSHAVAGIWYIGCGGFFCTVALLLMRSGVREIPYHGGYAGTIPLEFLAGIAAIIIFMGFVQLLIAFILKVREKTHRKN